MRLFDRRSPTRLLALALLLLGAAPATASEAGYSFAATPGRLPKTVVPTHYALELAPDLDRATLAGLALIDIEVAEPTQRIVLNALELTIAEAELVGEAGQVARVSPAPEEQTAALDFPAPLAAGTHRLRVAFTARINGYGRGLFSIGYPADGARKRMFATHLEPADARRVFPGWDEPAFKATFATAVTLPEGFLAVGNMPVVDEAPAGPGLKRVVFATTPKMSSYLFVLAGGELERITAAADDVTVGLVATRGKAAEGRAALDSAVQLLGFFNEYFGVRYPLPKLDLIALPGGLGGAMENWGGITLFEGWVLAPPGASWEATRRSSFGIIAHEMAHQWFGNLVTMAWWDNVWLNEGFASWMEAKAAEALEPGRHPWIDGAAATESAMAQDARRTTHPIQQPVADESAALATFDGITYRKSRAFIRQLETWLGEDAFRDGIRRYMAAHSYSNATSADLWRALEAGSGKAVGAIAAGYTEQPGLPLVRSETGCEGGAQHVELRQERFTARDPEHRPEQWHIPIALATVPEGAAVRVLLEPGAALRVPAGRCGEPVKVNFGDGGYYRVAYAEPDRRALVGVAAALAPADRLDLLGDAAAFLETGRAAPAAFFELAEAVPREDARPVWDQVARTLGRLDRLERGRPEREALRAYARSLLRPPFEGLGWEARPGEDEERKLLRARLIRILGELGDPAVLAEAQRRFALFAADPATLAPDLREAVVHLAGRTADRPTYERLHALARAATDAQERGRLYGAMARALDPDFAEETLAITLTDEVPDTVAGDILFTLASAGEQPERAWEFALRHLDRLAGRLGPSFRQQSLAYLAMSFSEPARADEVTSLASLQETAGGRIAAARAAEAILIDADIRANILPAVDAWVSARATR
jgi:aminopeptidase N